MFEGPRPTVLSSGARGARIIDYYNVSKTTDMHPFNTNPLHVVLKILVRVKNDSEPRQSRRTPTLDPGEDLTSGELLGELAITF